MNKYEKLVNHISATDEISLDDLIHLMYLSGWSKRQMINYFGKDTSSSSFVEIDDVNDSVVTQWLTEHFNDKELELNSLLTFEDTGYMPTSLDDIDLNNPYG